VRGVLTNHSGQNRSCRTPPVIRHGQVRELEVHRYDQRTSTSAGPQTYDKRHRNRGPEGARRGLYLAAGSCQGGRFLGQRDFRSGISGLAEPAMNNETDDDQQRNAKHAALGAYRTTREPCRT
jgi:hypothetical protein